MTTGRLLRQAEVTEKLGVSRMTLHRWIVEGAFPPPLRLGARTKRWESTTLDKWIAERRPADLE